MAMSILVMGESGSGKTTAMRNLNPKETYYIDSDSKGLSWKCWRAHYNPENKNYVQTSDKDKILTYLQAVNDRAPHIKNVVIDTINGIMVDDEMARMKEKAYDKWADLAFAVYNITLYALKMRPDLNAIFLGHTQVERDDSGNVWTHLKTSGKKLDKIVLESKFTTVLLAKCVDGHYILETHANNSTAKTPLGAFPEPFIENDITIALKALEEYR